MLELELILVFLIGAVVVADVVAVFLARCPV